MIDAIEKQRILKVRSIGPKVVSWLEAADYQVLADFAAETPETIAFRVEIATGNPPNGNALTAYKNLIEAAKGAATMVKK